MQGISSCKVMGHSLFTSILFTLNMRNIETALGLVLKVMEGKSLMAITLKR